MGKATIFSLAIMIVFFNTEVNINSFNRAEIKVANNSSTEKWKQVKNSDNIIIYERLIKVENSRKVRQLKASMTVKAEISEVLSVIKDDKKAKKWQSGVKSFHHLKCIDKENWYSYSLYAIPWPLNNQDIVTKYQVIHSPKSNTIKIKMTGVPDYIPVKKGISRISHYCGRWVLTPIHNGSCKVDYYVYSKQKSSFPKWVVDPIVRNNLWGTFDNLRNMVNVSHISMID
ncbi:START domain-containing protein [Bacteroidota bacterium]